MIQNLPTRAHGMAGLCLAFGAAALVRLRVAVATSPAPFAATLGELDRDLAALRSPP